ncbi:WASH complex subunit 2 [Contarinia nasturtii]|uniref:WASH complex subunit 2 n=1 Tax=Contarinia nasturtii TaxID=265458 RepID=UPI0012D4A7B6|nr:WASH complex subunit 2 [Contarinia nasturtii]
MSDKDKPWTADDIRLNATNWSLQCDGKLLEYMQNLSKTIQDRGNRTTYNLHTSMLELDRTKITLENATNQLMALQHKQFIENRVYDDDETIASIENVPTTDSQHIDEPKPSVIEALQNAIDTGMQMVDKYFDKVTFELSDSDDDDDGEVQNSIVFRPKNLYEHRPLPYLIGSKEWHEKWHIGLIDEESDGSDNESSVSLSSSSAESISSNVPVSLSEADNPNVVPSKKLADVKLSDSQDLFHSSSDENLSRSLHESIENSTAYHKQSFETSKIAPNVKPADSNEIKTNNSIFMPQKPIATSHTIPTLIDSDPPELDDVPTIKNVQKPANLFLDDENDVDDYNIFNDKNAKGATQKEINQKAVTTPGQTKSINLFADDDDGENFDSFLPTKTTNSISATPQKMPTKLTNLFEDDDDFDDELFLQPPEQKNAQKPPTSILSNTPKNSVFLCNLFSDEPPEDDFDVIATSAPKPSTSKDADQKPKIVTSPEKSTKVSSAVEPQPKKSTDLFSNKINLFDDEEEEDPFEKLIANSKNDNTSDQKKSSKILFDSKTDKIDRSENEEEATTTIQSSKKSDIFSPVNLFNDDTLDDDDLFANITSPKDGSKEKTGDISKQNTGEFYNDFSDTVTIPKLSKENEENTQHSEKKLTSPSEPKKAAISEIDGSTSGKVSSGLLKKIDVFSNSVSNVKKEETTTAARQPKKLNITHMDINVNALLPGAKRTQPSKKSDDLNKEDANTDVSDTTITSPVNKVVNEDNIDGSGRLVNLNRNRPKNLSRRPSTRAGRKQQYQKSLEDENHSHKSTESTDYVDNIPEIKDSIPVAQNPIRMIADGSRSRTASVEDELFETNLMPEDNVVAPNEQSALNESDFIEKKLVEHVEPVEQSMAPENENSFSFLDEEENDDFLDFQSPVSPKLINENNAPFVKATPAYIDELPPDLDFAEETSQNNKSNNATSYLSENALSLFDDDDEDDYNDGIFSTETPKQTPSDAATKLKDDWSPDLPNSNVPTPSNVKKLADNDDSLVEDDLFDSPITTVIKNESNKKQQPTKTLSSSSVTKQNLFGDNDDDDDLFGGPPAIIEQVKKVQSKKPASKIFSDDSSDDDLFGGKIIKKSQSKPPTVTATTSMKTPKNNKGNEKLFSDSEDDDDDLFGTKVKPKDKSKKMQPSASSKPVKEDTQKPVKLLTTSTVENDPLADLLK